MSCFKRALETGKSGMLSDAVNRKLTTIFAADVVGYSQLMATNEETTLGTLQACLKVVDSMISKHGGRIFNTAGDSVMAEFNSAVEAVRCAISIQEDLRVRNQELSDECQMWLRIGINVGDVMVDEENLFGDGVNIAARLEALADKGGICLSGSAFDLVKNKLSIAFEDIGDQRVKNIPEPIPAFRLIPGQVSVEDSNTRASLATNDSTTSRTSRFWFITGTMVAVLCILVFAIWNHFPFRASSKYPFDGKWRIIVSSLSGCLNNVDRTYAVRVIEGKVDEPQYNIPKVGTISKDGSFTIKSIDDTGTIWNTQLGKLDGDTGKGSFQGRKPGCRGNISLTRLS